MRNFKIEFEVLQRSVFYASVEAETPEEALRKFREDPCNYDSDEDDLIDSENISGSEEVIGEWVKDEEDPRFLSLIRFNEPIR